MYTNPTSSLPKASLGFRVSGPSQCFTAPVSSQILAPSDRPSDHTAHAAKLKSFATYLSPIRNLGCNTTFWGTMFPQFQSPSVPQNGKEGAVGGPSSTADTGSGGRGGQCCISSSRRVANR